MTARTNHFGQPIGPSLTGWIPPAMPSREVIDGRYCRLEPLDVDRHAADLHAANQLDVAGRNWTYLPYGPFESFEAYRDWLHTVLYRPDPHFFAIIDKSAGKALGVAS